MTKSAWSTDVGVPGGEVDLSVRPGNPSSTFVTIELRDGAEDEVDGTVDVAVLAKYSDGSTTVLRLMVNTVALAIATPGALPPSAIEGITVELHGVTDLIVKAENFTGTAVKWRAWAA